MNEPFSQEIPIIDAAPLYSGRDDGLASIAAQISAACRGIGFFYVANHGVEAGLVKAAFEKSAELFALDVARKEAVSIARSRHNRGYIGFGGEALDPTKPPDIKEAFNIGLDLAESDPEVVAGKPFRGVNLWPDREGFRETMLAYFDAVWRLGRDLHRAFAVDLQLSPDYFEDKLDRPMATLRLLHYPSMPSARAQGQLGAGEHTDYGNITLLATDEVGGLEVRSRSGDWLSAPVIPGTFVCNIGDCLMRWTNDRYVSTPHRVVNPTGRERYSIAFFLDPNPEALVECLPSCTLPGESALYPPIRADAFLRSRLDPTYAHKDRTQGVQ
jgi:isopenicillin N synthase-like dioxygenase